MNFKYFFFHFAVYYFPDIIKWILTRPGSFVLVVCPYKLHPFLLYKPLPLVCLSPYSWYSAGTPHSLSLTWRFRLRYISSSPCTEARRTLDPPQKSFWKKMNVWNYFVHVLYVYFDNIMWPGDCVVQVNKHKGKETWTFRCHRFRWCYVCHSNIPWDTEAWLI